MSKFNPRKKDLIQLALVFAIIIVVNLISSNWFFRIDLTAEKRYTLAPVTRDYLRNLDHQVLVRVYLHGDLNVGFQRLARTTRETLEEFRLVSRGAIQYEFVEPAADANIREELREWGLSPVPVYEAEADGRRTQTNVYPYAIFHIDGYELPVNLLENLPGKSGAENLNISMESLEYKITDAMRRLVTDEVPAVAFLEGHGELDEWDVYDITEALSHYYQVDRGVLTGDPWVLDNYEAIIIAKPQERFSERDKFIIDQYIMRGGKVLWMVDAVNVTLDSLRRATQTVGLATDVNLSDQLFRYGVRINHELLQDIQAAMIPINTAPDGQQPRFVPVPWLFNPLLNVNMEHPVTRNLNAVRGEFVSSIDTVGIPEGISREVLLHTSRFTRRLPVPVYISLAMVNERPEREDFRSSYVPVAVAMEGSFPSVFANRMIPPEIDMESSEVRHQSEPTRMIVVADGDIIKNEVRNRHGASPRPMPLGFDEMGNQTFGNKQFILNAINYLVDDEGWMELRTRNYELRLLDREKLSSQIKFWQTINVLVPLLFLLLIGVTLPVWRKLTFGKQKDVDHSSSK
ncbi:gliding motility-associated ABC transporter substrate-binding protein GldG [Natronoflexus pectinivorans]|uniref:Gliding-associated putative ABC transporter substrate-binding component GldG n=1 Tax=Natronoflexus pectinivorans TaxID=682526 RepID=A0A4R2GHN9_9BACT|nr:gliding motility-associated ABC transporter substrate-binding protein GldG [Natronoflexus pectinivorans]TCO07320.1 gliding-associated putative ABC transporter substrate-binding component GldG [Natronoflexus pectinivorans]